MQNEQTTGKAPICPESTIESANRRHFVKKAAVLAAAAGIGSSLIGSATILPESSAISSKRVKYCCPTGTAITGSSCSGTGVLGTTASGVGVKGSSSCCGTGVLGCSPCGYGVYGNSACGYGVFGVSKCGYGLYGISCSESGVVGVSCSGTAVCGSSIHGAGVSGSSSCNVGIQGNSSFVGVKGVATGVDAVPLVAQGVSCQRANLQQWEKSCGASLSVVNKQGWLGLGTSAPTTTLRVNGSLSLKLVSPSTNYVMDSSDFAVVASARSSISVTLPPANTASGMIVFIKNASGNPVEIFPHSNEETIEGNRSFSLKKKYDSLQLISNGSNEWFILGN